MDRSTGLGGTDAMRIMKGEWNALWKEKMGQAEPVDLSNIFRVQLGIFTERFHLEWIARQKEWSIEIAPALRKRTLDGVPMFANLDGWIKDKETFIDAKHSSSKAIAYNIVEDVKGMIMDVYLLKKKLMLAVHGIEVVEIAGKSVGDWAYCIAGPDGQCTPAM